MVSSMSASPDRTRKLRVDPPSGVLVFEPAVTNAFRSYVLSAPKYIARFQIINVSAHPARFKVKTNASTVYTVNPVTGVIDPGATQEIVLKTATPKAIKPTAGAANALQRANAELQPQDSKVPTFISGHVFLVVADGDNELYLAVRKSTATAWFSFYDIVYICIFFLLCGLLTPYLLKTLRT